MDVQAPSYISRLFPIFDLLLQLFWNLDQEAPKFRCAALLVQFVQKKYNDQSCSCYRTEWKLRFPITYVQGISDVEIVNRCGFLDNFKPGSVVLADRGFLLTELAASKGITWIVPPNAPQHRGLTGEELWSTYKIARVRIHVERSIEMLESWRALMAQFP